MTTEIDEIEIESSPGYVPIVFAYGDCLTITPDSISYEYRPTMVTEKNPKQKWCFWTDSREFTQCYAKIAEIVEQTVRPEHEDEDKLILDAGMIHFKAVYSDESVITKSFSDDSDRFRELYELIASIVPNIAAKPRILWTSDDYDRIRF